MKGNADVPGYTENKHSTTIVYAIILSVYIQYVYLTIWDCLQPFSVNSLNEYIYIMG